MGWRSILSSQTRNELANLSSVCRSFGYQFADLGSSFAAAYEKMTQGIPVVVSVQAGTFTTSGHIMVLALNKEGTIQVFDPNDSRKAHYEKSYPNDVFQAEGIHYWSFWL